MPPILNWLLYDCALALAPIVLVWVGFYFLGQHPTLADIVRDGQLFVYCSALSAATLGDVNSATNVSLIGAFPRGCWTFGLGFAVAAASCFYGVAFFNQDRTNKHRVARASWIFALSVTALIGFLRFHFSIF